MCEFHFDRTIRGEEEEAYQIQSLSSVYSVISKAALKNIYPMLSKCLITLKHVHLF